MKLTVSTVVQKSFRCRDRRLSLLGVELQVELLHRVSDFHGAYFDVRGILGIDEGQYTDGPELAADGSIDWSATVARSAVIAESKQSLILVAVCEVATGDSSRGAGAANSGLRQSNLLKRHPSRQRSVKGR